MKRKIFSIFFALVLVTSFSLVTAVPVGASPDLPEVEFQESTSGSAEWSTVVEAYSGTYSVFLSDEGKGLLDTPGGSKAADWGAGRVVIPGVNIALATITDLSYWFNYDFPDTIIYPDFQAFPYMILECDSSGGTAADLWIVLISTQIEYTAHTGGAMPAEHEWLEWTVTGYDNWHDDGSGATLDVGQPTDGAPLVDFQTAYPNAKVLKVKVAVGEWASGTYDAITGYVDDIEINGVTYDLEPRVINTNTSEGFNTIQDAIDSAVTDDIINVAAGTYDLITPIAVTEDVTLTGDVTTPSNVVVNAPTTGTDRDCFQVKERGVTIQGFKMQGALDVDGPGGQNSGIVIGAWWDGAAIPGLQYIAISHNEITGCNKGISVYRAQHVTISYNDIHQHPTTGPIAQDSWPGKGIMLYGEGSGVQNNDIDILENDIYRNGLFGIELNHWAASTGAWVNVDVLIDGNTIYDNGGPWDLVGGVFDCGRGISANGHETGVTITNNEIYGHWSTSGERFWHNAAGIRPNDSKGWVISDNNIHDNMRGIHIYGTDLTFGDENTGFVVTGNDVHDNAQGIVFGDGDVGYAEFNNIYDNDVTTYETDGVSPCGAVNLGAVTFDATNNWWGDAVTTTTAIESLISGAVDYSPWLVTSPIAGTAPNIVASIHPWTWYTNDSIQDAINEASSDDTINVAAGMYNENIVVGEQLTLEGAQAGEDPTVEGARTDPAKESTIQGSGGTAVTISANNVTIDGFRIENPNGTAGIRADGQSYITIKNNIVTNIDGVASGTGNQGIAIAGGDATPITDITIEDNQVNGIQHTAVGRSATGIWIGNKNGSSTIDKLVIQRNTVSNILANTSPWQSGEFGGKGAYGILIGYGGETVAAQILDNTITDLEGLWAHGIGLEGNTPSAVVERNDISHLIDHKTPSDAVAVQVEDNQSAATLTIEFNSVYKVNVGVQNVVDGNPLVTAENNWWGHSSGTVTVGNVDIDPWLLTTEGLTNEKLRYDKTLSLPADWSIVSPDAELDSWVSVDAEELMYAYDGGGFTTNFILDPVTPIFIKAGVAGGGIGFNYAASSQGIFTTNLEAGWNLIGVPQTGATPEAILSSIRLGANNEVALATLASQGNYNPSGETFYESMLILEQGSWVPTALYPFDGYWAYMNVAKEFGVVVVPAQNNL